MVGRTQDRAPPLSALSQQRPKIPSRLGIESHRRLVHDDKPRILQRGQADHESALQIARKFHADNVVMLLKPQVRGQPFGPSIGVLAIQAS